MLTVATDVVEQHSRSDREPRGKAYEGRLRAGWWEEDVDVHG